MVCVDEIVVRRGGDVCGALHCLLDDVAHLQEAALVLKESTVHNLVGRIDDTRHVAATLDGLEGEGQAAELFQVGLEELQWMAEQVEPLARERQSLGVREGVLDGQAHVGHAELGLHGAVLELHGAVDDALWMHQHLYLTGLDAEEPLGLDYLEALVHHRC